MRAHVLLNLLIELGKRDIIFFAASLIYSVIQEHEYKILYGIKITLK